MHPETATAPLCSLCSNSNAVWWLDANKRPQRLGFAVRNFAVRALRLARRLRLRAAAGVTLRSELLLPFKVTRHGLKIRVIGRDH